MTVSYIGFGFIVLLLASLGLVHKSE
jgi:hypothetical protein